MLSPYTIAEIQTKIIESTQDSVILEFTSTDVQFSQQSIQGQNYQHITLAGAGLLQESNKPQLPVKGVLLAVPTDAEIALHVLETEIETRPTQRIIPYPTFIAEMPKFSTDNEIYHSNQSFPSSPVRIGLQGNIRSQQVAQLQFFPVLYQPVSEKIIIYKRLRVQIAFIHSLRSQKPIIEDSAAFHELFGHLLINDKSSQRILQKSSSYELKSNTCPPGEYFLKVSVDQEGVYAISYDDLLALGLDVSSINPRLISMNYQGIEVPIFILGEEDGVFNKSDKIFFYATAMTSDYTHTNVYWFSLKPQGGARMSFKSGTPTVAPLLSAFIQTQHAEENKEYWPFMPNGKGDEKWFWARLVGGKNEYVSMNIVVNNPLKNKTAKLRVKLQGRVYDIFYQPSHHTQVFLNGNPLQDAYWNGQEVFIHELDIPQQNLLNGTNTVTLVSIGNTGSSVDEIYVDYAEIEYSSDFIAVNNQLQFSLEGTGQQNITVTGFKQAGTTPFIVLLDVTNPLNVKPFINTQIQTDANGGYQLSFSDVITNKQTYRTFTYTPEQFLQPKSMEIVHTSSLKSSCHQADYLLVYHDSFDVSALQTLLEKRGLNVMAVKISDIYNEFSNGIFTPQALKDFFTYAYENYNKPRPTYVLLVGSANQDYMNRLGNGINYIPTYLTQTDALGDTATDNWFVTVSGKDTLPDMLLGRFPVKTQAELNNIVKKLANYSITPLDGWQKNILMAADNSPEFEAISDYLIQFKLSNYTTNSVYLSRYQDVTLATQDIIKYLNQGAILTSYNGHGGVENWSGKFMFTSNQIAALNNANRLTFAVILSCINGRFASYRAEQPLATTLLKAEDKGAIAVFAPTGLGRSIEHATLSEELFTDLFSKKVLEIGVLTTGAKIAGVVNWNIPLSNLEIYELFGEPSMKLRLQ